MIVQKQFECIQIFTDTFFTGTHDVDCPTNDSQNPFGLCCFDGCQNSCLKTCKTVLENVTTVSIYIWTLNEFIYRCTKFFHYFFPTKLLELFDIFVL